MRKRLPPSLFVYTPKSTYKGLVKQRDYLKTCLEKDYNMGWIEGVDWNFKYFLNEQYYTNYYQIVKHYQNPKEIDRNRIGGYKVISRTYKPK